MNMAHLEDTMYAIARMMDTCQKRKHYILDSKAGAVTKALCSC